MMVRLLAIWLLLTFGLQTGSSWGIMAWFVANQEAITEQEPVRKCGLCILNSLKTNNPQAKACGLLKVMRRIAMD